VIFQFILDTILTVIKGVFYILPTVPATPSAISTAGTWVTDQISGAMAVLNMVYGATLLAAIMVVIIAMFTFEWIYHTIMWIVRKLPMIGVS